MVVEQSICSAWCVFRRFLYPQQRIYQWNFLGVLINSELKYSSLRGDAPQTNRNSYLFFFTYFVSSFLTNNLWPPNASNWKLKHAPFLHVKGAAGFLFCPSFSRNMWKEPPGNQHLHDFDSIFITPMSVFPPHFLNRNSEKHHLETKPCARTPSKISGV